jgi:uncharacterized tellurite resistance protein B-like protein
VPSSSGDTTPGGGFAQTVSAGQVVVTSVENGYLYSDARHPAVMSREQMMAGLNARAGIRNPAPWILLGGAVAAAALVGLPGLAISLAIGACVAAAIANVQCRRSRQTILSYRLAPHDQRMLETVHAGIHALMSARAIWCATAESPSLAGRTAAHAGAPAIPYIKSNVPLMGIARGGETYCFLPDFVLVRTRAMFAAVSYEDVDVKVKALPFVETSFVPADANIAGRTWKYTKRDGTPDRRYRDNPQFPIVQYAHVLVRVSRYNLAILVSSLAGAEAFAAGLRSRVSGVTASNVTPRFEAATLPTPSPCTPAQEPVKRPTPAAEASTPRPASANQWVAADDSVAIAGFRIPGPIYSGGNLAAIKGYVAEPALIDPSKTIASSTAGFEPGSIPYWPSYSEIEPAARLAYLKWHASGRSAPDAPISFVFLYFYGLERRIFHDYGSTKDRGPEYQAILDEVGRLLEVYRANHSFYRYGTAFLEMAEAIHHTVNVDDPPPEYSQSGYDVPYRLKIALGVMSRDGKPIPAPWATAWICADPLFPRRTPFSRCNGYFRELFALRYQERWGVGIVVKPNKTILRLEYHPASASFGGPVTASTDLPDITVLKEPIGKLRELGAECVDALDAYSRYLGRNPGTEAHPAAMALLPPRLVAESQMEEARLIREKLTALVASATTLSRDDLLQILKAPINGTFGKRDAVVLAQYMASMGFGLEPDVRFGGPVPGSGTKLHLFSANAGAPSVPTPAYNVAALIVRLAASVSAADGATGQDGEQLLRNHIASSLHLSEYERTRLNAHLGWLLVERPGINGVKSRIESLATPQRQAIAKFLVEVANADGQVSPAEVESLGRLYRLLGLDSQAVYGDLHLAATDPVTVQAPGTGASGFVLPARRPKGKRTGIQLDPARIEAKLRETAAVSALLASVFVDEATPPSATAGRGADPQECIAGLDAANSTFLRYLSAKPIWSREELEATAAQRALLLDGSIEAINDAAFDACDQPLLEGEDPIEVNTAALTILLERNRIQ